MSIPVIQEIPVYCSHDEIVSIVKVIPNPRNPNMHPDKQIEVLAKVIEAQGWRAPVTISKRSGFVVRGHGRLMAAIHLGLDHVPVDYQDYENEAAEYADLIADNRIAELSHIDNDLMADLLSDINSTDLDILLTGFDFNELEEYIDLNPETDILTTEEPQNEPQKTTDTVQTQTTSNTAEQPNNDDEDYDGTVEKWKSNTGEVDVDEFSEGTYQHQCPKCKFMW